MPTPSKPISVIMAEGNRRRLSKKAIEHRQKQENALTSGCSFKEWDEVKLNPVAHKEFTRLKKIFKTIKKDDGLHESIINRYCLLHAECKEYEVMKNKLYEDLNNDEFLNLEFLERMEIQTKLQNLIMQTDKKIMEKRKMMLDIEKENIMTIASVLRSIPKKPVEDEESNPMAKFLNKKQG